MHYWYFVNFMNNFKAMVPHPHAYERKELEYIIISLKQYF